MDETQAKAALGSALCDLVRAYADLANAVAFPPERRYQIALAESLSRANSPVLKNIGRQIAEDAARDAFEALWRDAVGLPQLGKQA